MLEFINQSIQTKKRTEMKKYLLFIALACVLGNRALAQNSTETIDFSGWNYNSSDGSPYATLTWSGNSISSITATDNLGLTCTYTNRLTVSDTNNWRLWANNNGTYLQMYQYYDAITINDLEDGDLVTINYVGEFQVQTTYIVNTIQTNTSSAGTELQLRVVNGGGNLVIGIHSQNAGIRSITIQEGQGHGQQDPDPNGPRFNYDPGYEVYDFFEVRDVILERNSDGDITNGPTDNTQHTNYSVSDAGFELNGSSAQYFTFYDNDLTLNNRIAISQSGRWRFTRGLIVPSNVSSAYFSICNLREGDRIQIFYTGDAPAFASQSDGAYNGCSAFKDSGNDGDYNSDKGDYYITQGRQVESIGSRNEGTLARDEQVRPTTLYTSAIYVITEDGHMDFRLNSTNPLTRIVKVKIYSDHQATMVDEYDQENNTYWAHFDITGELQAKEHIVPGGLEVHVGNNEEDQHAIVVSSKFGPMSYVNAAQGFKIPGITENNGNISINFNLKNELPETGTFYRFIAEESGEMTVKFQGNSIYYYRYDIAGNAIYYDDGLGQWSEWSADYDRANEQTANRPCTYYLMEVGSNNTPIVRNSIQVANGFPGEITYTVEKGKVYYIYGVWTEGANWDNSHFINPRNVTDNNQPYACGVAELYEVQFKPSSKIFPLAKWVPNGTTAVNTSTYYLADVVGFNDAPITVKKMSGNITGCHPYIERARDNVRDGKLMIDNITFAEDKNPGGVILIKIGDPSVKSNPVYALTIAYSADEDYDNELGEGIRGHVWDFSSNSLNGLTWNNGYPTATNQGIFNRENGNDSKYAVATDYGTYFEDYFNGDLDENKTNGGSLLWQEMNYEENGIARSDWMFNYRLQRADGNNSDPRFLNKYDMEGDNADMIWDTEGIVLLTSSNQSCIFNEYKGSNIHASATDPDRYVGILEGGSFLIPWLEQGDRVIIYMGSGEGTGTESIKFNITNACDALNEPITSEYIAGGSQWNSENNDPYYRGCYHFFAKEDGDMIFEMTGGSMCKIYSIQIYRGRRIKTNDLVPVGDSPLYLVNKKGTEETAEGTYSIQYRGKGESIDDPEMAGMTGNLANATYSLTSLNDDNTTVKFTATANDKFGVFNMRLNDLERNNTYVADFADRNFPIGYYEELPQPYTWDFTDVNRFNTTYLASENNKYSADDLNIWDAEKNFTWKRDDTDDLLFAPGGQIYADAQMIAESAGMRFTPMNVGSGTIQATADGLIIKSGIDDNYSENAAARPVTGGAYGNNSEEKKSIWEIPWETSNYHPTPINYDSSIGEDPRIGWKLTIPNLPNLTTAYIRVQTIKDLKPKLTLDFARGYFNEAGQPVNDSYGDWNFFKKVIDNGDGTKDIILGLSPTNGGSPEPFSFILNNVIVKKIATSKDIKPAFGKTGYQTESRHREIDHRLTGFFTGEDIEAFYGTLGTNNKGEKVVKLHHLDILDKADPNYTGDGIGGEGDVNWRNSPDMEGKGCILYHRNGVEVTDKNGNPQTDRSFSILDGGFHLFVPDMHDMDAMVGEDDLGGPDAITSENILWARYYNADVWGWDARVDRGLAEMSGNDINYGLSASHYNRSDEIEKGNGYDVGFYHVSSKGASIATHSAYIRMSSGDASLSKIFFDFAGDFFEENHGITTQIDDASHLIDNGQLTTGHADWYNLNGQKLSGKPSANGLYIKNGKKVIIK